MGVGTGQGRKGSGGSNHNRWQKGVVVQILFGVECVDEKALQAVFSLHLGGAVREEKAGGRSKVGSGLRARRARVERKRKSGSLGAEKKELGRRSQQSRDERPARSSGSSGEEERKSRSL